MESRHAPVVRNLPNVLTTLRLAAVPVLIVLMVEHEGASLAAGLLFLVAAFTDFLDGFLARRFHLMSQYGKLVDPLADRLLVNSAVLLLCYYDSRWFGGGGRLLGPEFLVVIARDALAVYGYLRVRSFAIPDVTWLGKLGMALMMVGLTWLLLLPEHTWPLWPFELGLVLSVAVLVQYVRRYGRVLRSGSSSDAPSDTAGSSQADPAPSPRVD